MDKPHLNVLKWSSWASLVVPLVGYALCSLNSTGHLLVHAPPWGRSVGVLRVYAFLVSATIGFIVLLGDVGFRRWRLCWLPLAGLILTYLLYAEAAWFTRFFQ
jgi:hypothetical protein